MIVMIGCMSVYSLVSFSGFDIIGFKFLILFISENKHSIVILHEHPPPLSLEIYTVVLSVSEMEKKNRILMLHRR